MLDKSKIIVETQSVPLKVLIITSWNEYTSGVWYYGYEKKYLDISNYLPFRRNK